MSLGVSRGAGAQVSGKSQFRTLAEKPRDDLDTPTEFREGPDPMTDVGQECDEEARRALLASSEYTAVEGACRGCMGPCGRCHEEPTSVDAVDPSASDPGKPSTGCQAAE